MPQSLTLTAHIVKLLLRLELSGVPAGSTTVEKEHHIGVLLQAAGFFRVGEHGLLLGRRVLQGAAELADDQQRAPSISRARALRPRLITLISCCRFSWRPTALMSWM